MPGDSAATATDDNTAVVVVSGEARGLRLWVRATNLWAGTLLAGLAVIGLQIWGDPAKLQTLQLLSMYVAGLFTSAALMNGRVRDALADKNYYRDELNRVTQVKAELEAQGLQNRQSSAPIKQQDAQNHPNKSKKPRKK
jgi:hypothetical protein